jgi:hypothetical protein
MVEAKGLVNLILWLMSCQKFDKLAEPSTKLHVAQAINLN